MNLSDFLYAPASLHWAIGALFALLAAASAIIHWRKESAQSELCKQIDAWWIFLPTVTLAVLTHPSGSVLLSALIVALGLRELAPRLANSATGFVFAGAFLWLTLRGLAASGTSMLWIVSGTFLLALAVFIASTFGRLRQRSRMIFALGLLLVLGVSCVNLMQHLPIQPIQAQSWLFFLFALTAINDICQFIVGKRFGNRKVAPTCSPNKTWEGFLGGLLGSTLFSILLGTQLELASVPHLIGLGLALGIIGFFGDLVFSSAKRRLDIKDFSQLIPGHGGVLDRVDSLVFTAPALYLWLGFWLRTPLQLN